MILDRFRLTDRVADRDGRRARHRRGLRARVRRAGRGCRVAARTPAQLEAVAEKIRKLGRRALVVPTDVNEAGALEALVDRTLARVGRIDIVVNNAGGTPPRRAPDQRQDVRAVVPLQRGRPPSRSRGRDPAHAKTRRRLDREHLVRAGRVPPANFVAYGTAKAALSFMTRQLAAEFAPVVRVNAIGVGAVEDSALMPYLNDELQKAMEKLTPMQRLGEVEDIATMALYLASPASGWVTGKVFEVDGGTEATNWPF